MTIANTPRHNTEAVDADERERPGVPMETAPRPAGAAHWDAPERMPPPDVTVYKTALRDELTPVFSTANPPRGLSGALRKVAYTVPEHRVSHWMLLLLSDRVDALEHGAWRPYALAAPLVLVGVGAAMMMAARPKRRRGLMALFG